MAHADTCHGVRQKTHLYTRKTHAPTRTAGTTLAQPARGCATLAAMAKLTLTDAAQLTGTGRSTLYRALRAGRLSRDPDCRLDTA